MQIGLLVSSPFFAQASKHVSGFRLIIAGLAVWCIATAGAGLSTGTPHSHSAAALCMNMQIQQTASELSRAMPCCRILDLAGLPSCDRRGGGLFCGTGCAVHRYHPAPLPMCR